MGVGGWVHGGKLQIVFSLPNFFLSFFLPLLPFFPSSLFPSLLSFFLPAFLLFLFSVKNLVIFFWPLIRICTYEGRGGGGNYKLFFISMKNTFTFLLSSCLPSFPLLIFFLPLIQICTFGVGVGGWELQIFFFLAQKTHLHFFFASFLPFPPSSGNCHFKHNLWPNMTKIITLNANAKEIITLNTVYDQM